MSDNPAEAALNELKKWLELLKKIMAMMEEQKKALAAEQKAIGDKALAAHKEMVAKTKHDELLKEFKEIKESIKNTPDGTPGKDAALKEVANAEKQLDLDNNPDVDVDDPSIENSLDEIDAHDTETPEIDAPDGVALEAETVDLPGPDIENAVGDLNIGESAPGMAAAGSGVGDIGGAVNNAVKGLQEGLQKGLQEGGKQSTGEALGWVKGEKGWQNKEGLSVKELGNKVSEGVKLGAHR